MSDAKWSDLVTRVASAVVMLLIFGLAIWTRPLGLNLLVAVVFVLAIFELATMAGLTHKLRTAIVAVAASVGFVAMFTFGPDSSIFSGFFLMLLLPILLCSGMAADHKALIGGYGVAVAAGFWAFFGLVNLFVIQFLFLVVAIVIATDIAGYFAGRMLGGPKFWPAISPKKTWSGTIAGWVAAAVIGFVTLPLAGAVMSMVLAIAISFAGQMGDIFESAVKRKTGVKDSSNLIPGHGGVLDRIDAMLLAAFAFVTIFALGGGG